MVGVGALLLIVGIFAAARRRSRVDVEALLSEAYVALDSSRYKEAHRAARKILRRQPSRTEAWLVYGASQVRLKGLRSLIRKLEPVVARLPEPAPVAFLLATAHVRLNNMEAARKWAQLVKKDPAFYQYVAEDQWFRQVYEDYRRRPEAGAQAAGIAYA